MKRVPCKEQALGFHIGSLKVKGHSKPMRPVLLRVYVLKEEIDEEPTEYRFVGLREGNNMYVVPFSEPERFFKICSCDTIGIPDSLPMGIPTRKLYTDSSNWNSDEKFNVLHRNLLNNSERATFDKIQEMLPKFEPLKTWRDLPDAF